MQRHRSHVLTAVSYLPQLAQQDAEVLLLQQLAAHGGQVVFDNLGTEADLKLVYVIVIEGERGVADDHLGDIANCAVVCWNTVKVLYLYSQLEHKWKQQVTNPLFEDFVFLLMEFVISFLNSFFFRLLTPAFFRTGRKYFMKRRLVFYNHRDI